MAGAETGELDRFDAATAVTEVGDGRYAATLDADYAVLGNPNGGYLLAVLARAATTNLVAGGTDHPDCIAGSASFVRATTVGEAEVELAILRRGARVSHVRATLRQRGQVTVDAELACGRLPDEPDVSYELECPVVLPDVEVCERRPVDGVPGINVEIMDRVDLRLDPAVTRWARGELVDTAEVRGWLRLADGRRMDPLALLFALDVMPPATLPVVGLGGWVPTIQLSAYVRAWPAEGWLVARQLARTIGDGLVDEVCELWDARGHAVAQATQLAVVRA